MIVIFDFVLVVEFDVVFWWSIDIVIFNEIEVLLISGIEVIDVFLVECVGCWFFDQGVGVVVIMFVGQGFCVVIVDGVMIILFFFVEVVDIIVVGDVYVGYFGVVLVNGSSLLDVVWLVMVVGVLVVMKQGVLLSFLYCVEVEVFLYECVVMIVVVS